ncbi:transposase [Thiohalocapsa halophila]|uniref:Transposase n=1 Tax=Thiohalocapsa halophila TaxID=69359 RepID=A0ABS1CEA4_9GAMM|nr:transposase [Thiohalocapsa halophila]MBK1629829.1 transposase [Thiohalocapsa halophila]
MARSRYRFAEHDRPHFLTATVVEWLPVFTRPQAAQVLFDAWAHQQQHAGLRLYGFVVLENHLHAVAQAPDLPKTWGAFKSFTARRLIDLLRRHGATRLLDRMAFAHKAGRDDRAHQFWQEGSHPQGIEGEAMLWQKLEYIHNNPVKRGFVDRPEDWRWSSARSYQGREGVVEVFTGW